MLQTLKTSPKLLLPINLALLYMQTERLCQLSFHRAPHTSHFGITGGGNAQIKYGPKPTIPVTGNQEFFTT